MTHTDQQSDTSGQNMHNTLLDHTPATLSALFASWNEPGFRAKQVLDWVYLRDVDEYERMTNLSKSLRGRLTETLPILGSRIAARQDASDGVVKLLLEWPDGATTECVLIPDGERRTACISTQVGCPVGCVFCASGLDGLQRQLTPGEVIEQLIRIRAVCGDGHRLSNVVFMGLGEPLANYATTVHALRTINADWGLGIGARKITVSTVGLPTQMRRLADEKMQVTLALSLHAPTDELRREIIPWADRVSIQELTDACGYYFERTGREITLEYILLGGLNDGQSEARRLAAVARRMRANINLIAYNPVNGLPYRRPDETSIHRFRDVLQGLGVNTHLRRSRGIDIDAACGQLRRDRIVKLGGSART